MALTIQRRTTRQILIGKTPVGGRAPIAVQSMTNTRTQDVASTVSQIKRLEAMINSMTPHERRFPKVINGSRKKRIAAGSGTQIQDVNRLLKQFTQMQKMMKKMSKGGMKNMMRGMKGRMPPGMPF